MVDVSKERLQHVLEYSKRLCLRNSAKKGAVQAIPTRRLCQLPTSFSSHRNIYSNDMIIATRLGASNVKEKFPSSFQVKEYWKPKDSNLESIVIDGRTRIKELENAEYGDSMALVRNVYVMGRTESSQGQTTENLEERDIQNSLDIRLSCS